MGAQFEYFGDPYYSIPSVCNFFKQSYKFLLMKYKELGVLDIIMNTNFKFYNKERNDIL